MVFRKALKTELPQCTELQRDAFGDYAFFKVYVDDPKHRKNLFPQG